MGTGNLNAGDNPVMDLHPIHGGIKIHLVTSCYRNRDKLRPDGPLGSYADFYSMLNKPEGKESWKKKKRGQRRKP